jgi:hypothetical protein
VSVLFGYLPKGVVDVIVASEGELDDGELIQRRRVGAYQCRRAMSTLQHDDRWRALGVLLLVCVRMFVCIYVCMYMCGHLVT